MEKIKEHTLHTASVNSVAWGPHELGPILACASSDGKVSVLVFKDDGMWEAAVFEAHTSGVNSVSWAPATIPGALVQVTGGAPNVNVSKRFASCGCDNLVKIWAYSEETKEWKEEISLEGHTDWVRDVAWAPNFGLPQNYLASCSQDKTVIIWKKNNSNSPWVKKLLKPEKFLDVVWTVSWSMSGTILAVASGDNKVTLWQENLKGEWEKVQELDD
jgi:protein transport protein SEC13